MVTAELTVAEMRSLLSHYLFCLEGLRIIAEDFANPPKTRADEVACVTRVAAVAAAFTSHGPVTAAGAVGEQTLATLWPTLGCAEDFDAARVKTRTMIMEVMKLLFNDKPSLTLVTGEAK